MQQAWTTRQRRRQRQRQRQRQPRTTSAWLRSREELETWPTTAACSQAWPRAVGQRWTSSDPRLLLV